MNINNHGVVIGRLTRDPQIFDNSDGSKKVRFTVAAQQNYKKADGSRGADFAPLEALIPASANGKLGVYEHMKKGTKVGVAYSIRNNNYTDKDGNEVYGIVLQVQDVSLQDDRRAAGAAAVAEAVEEGPFDEA